MKVTLKFTGLLAKIAKSVVVEANTPREALTAIKLMPKFNPRTNNKRYVCSIKECKSVQDLDAGLVKKTLTVFCEGLATVPPKLSGSGNNPYIRIIIGIIIIILAVYFGRPDIAAETSAEAAGGASAGFTTMGAAAFSMGISLVMGGLSQLMMQQDQDGSDQSRSTNGFGNTVRSGTPIPIILGKTKWGGHLFTLNIETQSGKMNTLAEEAAKMIDINSINKWDSWRTLFLGSTVGVAGTNNGDAGGTGGGGAGGGGGDGQGKVIYGR
jgi:predicted phage tail protein